MKTIEDRAKSITIDNLDLSYIMSERPEVRRRCIEVAVQTAYVKGYKEALTDNEQLYCEIDNLHNLTFWLRLKNHELIIGEF